MNFLKTYKVPLAVFLASRAVVMLAIIFANGYGLEGGYATLGQWDAKNYLLIAQNGYHFSGLYNEGGGALIAFFPFLPILLYALHVITGLSLLYSGLLLSFVFGTVSAVLLYKLVLQWKGRDAAIMAVMLFSFYPSSFFLSSVYTESLFLLLTLSTFSFINTSKPAYGIMSVALACITRVTGSVLGLLYAWQVWQKTRSILKVLLYGFLACMPFLVFLYFQYRVFGTPFAFMEAQHQNWHQYGVFPWEGVWNVVTRALSSSENQIMWRSDLIYLLAACATLVMSFKTIPRAIWLFGAGVVLLTLSSSYILGMGRYLMLMLPFYFYWGHILATRKYLACVVIALSASLMALNTIVFSLSKAIF